MVIQFVVRVIASRRFEDISDSSLALDPSRPTKNPKMDIDLRLKDAILVPDRAAVLPYSLEKWGFLRNRGGLSKIFPQLSQWLSEPILTSLLAYGESPRVLLQWRFCP